MGQKTVRNTRAVRHTHTHTLQQVHFDQMDFLLDSFSSKLFLRWLFRINCYFFYPLFQNVLHFLWLQEVMGAAFYLYFLTTLLAGQLCKPLSLLDSLKTHLLLIKICIFSCFSFTLPLCLRFWLSCRIKECPTFSPCCCGVEALTETTFLLGLRLLLLINISVINLLWQKASPYPSTHPTSQTVRFKPQSSIQSSSSKHRR